VTLSLCPVLAQHQSGLDGFSKANFVGQDRPLGQGGAQGEQGCIYLMRVEIDAGVEKRRRDAIDVIPGRPAGQLMGVIFGVVITDHRCPRQSIDLMSSGDELSNQISISEEKKLLLDQRAT